MNRRHFIKQLMAMLALPNNASWAISKTNALIGAQWARYQKAIIIDGLSTLFDYHVDSFTAEQLMQINQSGITAVNATIPYPGDNTAQTQEKIDHAKLIINRYSSHLTQIFNVQDLLNAKSTNKLGVIFGFQSTEMFAQDLSLIEHFAKQGTKYMQLTYNGVSQFGDGGLVSEDRGLTSLGKDALAIMEQHKVLIDLSHAGQLTTKQAIANSTRPLTISHTGCNSIYQHPRNNDDQELKAVADKGGVIGIYLMPFLSGGTNEVTAAEFSAHLDYAINLCGSEHVAIGSDQGIFPILDDKTYRENLRKEIEQRIAAGISAPGESPNRPPFIPQLNAVDRMDLIAWHMGKSGHSDDTIEKVLGQNLLSLYKNVW